MKTNVCLLVGFWVIGSAISGQASTITLDWDAVTTNADGSPITDLAGYTVFQSTTDFMRGGVFISTTQAMADASIQKITTSASITTYTTTPLNAGTTYFFRLTAYDTSGNPSAFNVDASGLDVEVSTMTASSACDVNSDGSTNVADVQLEVNMAIGVAPCTVDINKDGVCNIIDVQRVVNAALGGACVSP
jgi:hypothetical protein